MLIQRFMALACAHATVQMAGAYAQRSVGTQGECLVLCAAVSKVRAMP
jgi:hypothetical protein